MFPAWHIAITALVTALLAGGAAAIPRDSRKLADILGVGLAAGLGVLLWRLGANTPALNNDPIPGISPADVLSGPLAYIAVAIYAGLRRQPMGWEQAAAATIAFIVNVVTI